MLTLPRFYLLICLFVFRILFPLCKSYSSVYNLVRKIYVHTKKTNSREYLKSRRYIISDVFLFLQIISTYFYYIIYIEQTYAYIAMGQFSSHIQHPIQLFKISVSAFYLSCLILILLKPNFQKRFLIIKIVKWKVSKKS